MKRVLVTGMSGTGKSTVIKELSRRGFKAVDADNDGLSELVGVPNDELTGLGPDADVLFVSGCSPNQGRFYPQFDHVILQTAPPDVLADRLAMRTTNPYGKRADEVARTLVLQQTIEPLLRRSAGLELDTRTPLDEVMKAILLHVGAE